MLIRPSPALFKRSVWKGTFLSFLLSSLEAAHVDASLGALSWGATAVREQGGEGLELV
jgi:hypothetical protein